MYENQTRNDVKKINFIFFDWFSSLKFINFHQRMVIFLHFQINEVVLIGNVSSILYIYDK